MGKHRLKLDSRTNIKRTLTKISNMVVNGELDTKTANTIILGCNAILSAIRKDEQEKQIEELANLLEELTNAKLE